ncbi:MAG TPA: DUF2891 family protein, partial [Methylomirabilota bacterium]|nr:DUF2891 family protein [Methylomirabilota bacterium]
ITTTKPHARTSGGAGPFTGSFDWHSAVHAHWALLSIARVTNDATLETLLGRRLTDSALEAERKFLKGQAGFEVPYGRAWLLLLLHEMTLRVRRPRAVAALRADTEAAVLDWLERSPYPEGGTGAAPVFNAAHDSWLFAYLLVALSTPGKAVTERMRKLRQGKLEPARAKLAKATHSPTDFLYLPAVQALVDRFDPTSTAASPYPVAPSPPLADPPLTDGNAHSAGAVLVRIWPYALHKMNVDAKACARFHARMNEMFSRPDHWADSFELVAHWVPQFMWMAVWLEAGRP